MPIKTTAEARHIAKLEELRRKIVAIHLLESAILVSPLQMQMAKTNMEGLTGTWIASKDAENKVTSIFVYFSTKGVFLGSVNEAGSKSLTELVFCHRHFWLIKKLCDVGVGARFIEAIVLGRIIGYKILFPL